MPMAAFWLYRLISSVERAPTSGVGGREFESLMGHHVPSSGGAHPGLYRHGFLGR